MSKWKKVKLGDIATYINGCAFKPSDWSNQGVPIVRIQNLTGSFSETNYYDKHYNSKYEINNGDVLISWSASLGVYVWDKGRAILNQHIFKVVFNKIDIDKTYFIFAVKSLLEKMEKQTHGATMKHITKPLFDNMEFPFPPMEEQKKIAARLDAVSDLLAKQKQLLSEQDNLIQSTFYDMFGTPFKNEKGFPYLQIKDLVSDVQYGTSQKADYTGKMPILRMNNITYSGEMDYTDLKYIDLEEETNKYILKKGDVLFNRTNSRELVGKTGLFNLDKLMVYAGYLIRVRLKEICLPIFLTKYMNTPQLKAFLKEKCKGIVGQANINAKEFQAIPIFLPPFELQQKFAAIAEQIESEKSKIKSAIAETQTLFNALMAEYFEE